MGNLIKVNNQEFFWDTNRVFLDGGVGRFMHELYHTIGQAQLRVGVIEMSLSATIKQGLHYPFEEGY